MKNRFLSIFVGVFLAIVLALGGVLSISVGIKNARSVVKYEKVSVDEECVHYLAAYYKMLYLKELNTAGIKARDTEEFWASASPDGQSYGELFEQSLRNYIASVVAAANIYLTYSSYTAEDKLSVNMTTEEILKYKADGDVSAFNAAAKKYGFNYNDFQNAAALLYKAQRAATVIFGEEGETLPNFPEECEKYLATYSRVSLLFVRDEQVFATDIDGNYLYDEHGNVALRDMTSEEKAERLALIDELRAKISSGAMTEELFSSYLERSNGDPAMYDSGYYFHLDSAVTDEFAKEFPSVVARSLEMAEGEVEEVECSIGVCFIYKLPVSEGAYSNGQNPFFADFYKNAAPYLYAEILAELAGEVSFKSAYDEIDTVAIPLIEEFYIREFKSAKK